MKHFLSIILPLCILFQLCCCSKLTHQPEAILLPEASASSTLLLKSGSGLDPKEGELNPDYFVAEKDLQAYLKYKRLIEKNTGLEGEITPLRDSLGNTLMYVINYPSGWELIAADKRCPAVLASDKEGRFVFEEQIPPIKAWLRCIGEDVKYVRGILSYDDVKDNDAIQMMREKEEFWKKITADTDHLREMTGPTKSGLDPIPYADGYWELYDAVIDTVDYQLVDHLVQTHWFQEYPYNIYCPLKTNSITEHAPAGCTAIAAGQVANYFHWVNGHPIMAPLTAYCDVQVPPYYPHVYTASSGDPHMYTTDLSVSAWDSIPSSGNMCAKLIAEIGIAVNMEYGNLGSGASELGESYFSNKGFTYNQGDYNGNALANNITAGKPVIAGALDSYTNKKHTFIIDAYEYFRVRMTSYYVWVTYEPVPWTPPTTYEEDFTIYKNISMNWGFGASFDNAWYYMFGDWTVSDHAFNSPDPTRVMLYNLVAPL